MLLVVYTSEVLGSIASEGSNLVHLGQVSRIVRKTQESLTVTQYRAGHLA